MNIFLPYEDNVVASVQALDDLRLNKQILECHQLFENAFKEYKGEKVKGYKNHPIYLHYRQYLGFVALYGMHCCYEYFERFRKIHKFQYYFDKHWAMRCLVEYGPAFWIPFYMEGSKGQPNYIRTTENVSELFQRKLIKKWQNDKRPPKWTNRGMPEFYKKFLEEAKG